MPRLNVFEKFLFRFDSDMEVPFVKKLYLIDRTVTERNAFPSFLL